jgi:hypothetical protein
MLLAWAKGLQGGGCLMQESKKAITFTEVDRKLTEALPQGPHHEHSGDCHCVAKKMKKAESADLQVLRLWNFFWSGDRA